MAKSQGFFVEYSILDIWQGSEFASVICYSLFGKIEDNNINLLILKFKHNYHILCLALSKTILKFNGF